MFRHNAFTGRRTLWLDGAIIFQSGLRYRCVSKAWLHCQQASLRIPGAPAAAPRIEMQRCCAALTVCVRRLIGSVGFMLADGSEAVVTIGAGPRLELVYELVVNGERVTHGASVKGTTWSFTLRPGPDSGAKGGGASGDSSGSPAAAAGSGSESADPGEMDTAPPLTSCDTAGRRVEVEFGEEARRAAAASCARLLNLSRRAFRFSTLAIACSLLLVLSCADHSSYDVLVNRRVVPTEADFLEDGEGSALTVPLPGGQTCQVMAKVGPKGDCVPLLTYLGDKVLTVEERGADESETTEELLAASGVRAS